MAADLSNWVGMGPELVNRNIIMALTRTANQLEEHTAYFRLVASQSKYPIDVRTRYAKKARNCVELRRVLTRHINMLKEAQPCTADVTPAP